MSGTKTATGTVQIVCGAVLLVAAVVGLIQLPGVVDSGVGATIAGNLVGTLVFAGVGVLLLVLGLKRRTNAS